MKTTKEAQRFAREMTAAMKKRKLKTSTIAEDLQIGNSSVYNASKYGMATKSENARKIAEYLDMDISYLPDSPRPTKEVVRKDMGNGTEFVSEKIPGYERCELVDKPTMTDSDPMLELNEAEPCIYVDDTKYTADSVKALLAHIKHLDTVIDNQTFRNEELQKDYDELEKKCSGFQVECEELRGQLAERENELINMPIGEALKIYRACDKLFKPEVLK